MEPKKRNDLNQVSIGGYLTADPVQRDSGIFFTVAVRRDKENTDFLPVCIRGERGKKYTFLKKGSNIVISGHLHQWKGDKGTRLLVDTDRIHFGAVGLNNVVLTGRLTADPESFTANSGKKGYRVSLASERSWNTESGLQSHTSFIDVCVWNDAMQHLQKGAMCTVVGTLQSRNYQNKDGENRTAYQVTSSRIAFAPKRDDDSGEENASRPAESAPQNQPSYAETPQYSVPDFDVIDDDDEDLPF